MSAASCRLTVATAAVWMVASGAGRIEAAPTPTAPFKRTIVVSGAGTPPVNGAALRAALTSIDNASAANPWLVHLEPGSYDLGKTAGLDLKSFVDLEGSGRGATLVVSKTSSAPVLAIANGVSTEIRDLSLQQFVSSKSRGVSIASSAARLSRVDISLRGNDCDGVVVVGASPSLDDVQVRIQSTGVGRGFVLEDSSATLRDAVATVSAANGAAGLVLDGSEPGTRASATALRLKIQDGQRAQGVRLIDGLLTLQRATLDVQGGPEAHGILVEGGNLFVQWSQIAARSSPDVAGAVGLRVTSSNASVEGSSLEATTAVGPGAGTVVNLVRSRLVGSIDASPTALLRCRESYRADLTLLGENCQ